MMSHDRLIYEVLEVDMKDTDHEASPKGKRKLEFIEKKKVKTPLFGKTIFLDVKETRIKRRLEDDILRLGATVETFLSKDINYLITTNPPPKPNKNDDKFGSPESPAMSTPSPFNMGPSPSTSNTDNLKKPAPPMPRGKAIYNKAKVATQNNVVVGNAQKWGVKIVGLEVAQKWILKEVAKLPQDEKKGSQRKKVNSSSKGGVFKVKPLKAPFIKFEDLSKQYKVVYQNLTSWPHVNLDTPKGTCPFDGTKVGQDDESIVDRRDKIGLPNIELHSEDEGEGNEDSPSVKGKEKKSDSGGIIGPVRIVTAGEIRRRAEKKRLQEKKRGYCECCQIKYENLDQHIREEQHKSFVREKKNYESLDHLIKTGTNCNTAKFLERTLRSHLQKGKQSSEEVDVSIPQEKQWTPRKSSTVKMMLKKQRQEQLKWIVNPPENMSVDEKLQENSKTVKLDKNDGGKSEISGEKKNMKMENNTGCSITEDENVLIIPPNQKSPKRSRSRTDSKKEEVLNKLENMVINSPIELRFIGLKINNADLENSIQDPSQNLLNIKQKQKNDRKPSKGEVNQKIKQKTLDKNEDIVLKNEEKNVKEGKNISVTIGHNNSGKDRGRRSDKESIEKKDKNDQDEKLPCSKTKYIEKTKGNVTTKSFSNDISSIGKEKLMDVTNHYVPKVAKTFFIEQNMSPGRVDWGESSLPCKVKDEKISEKRWSQKLAAKNHVPENGNVREDKLDEVDGTCVGKLSDKLAKNSTAKNTAITGTGTKDVLNNLTKKYCEDKTIYLDIDMKNITPRPAGIKSTGSPVFGKSPAAKCKRKLVVPQEADIYDFNESPKKYGDVYEFDSEVSLICSNSPVLSKHKKTNSTQKVNKKSESVKNMSESVKRKKWRKKIDSNPNSDSDMRAKKIDKLKVKASNSETDLKSDNGIVLGTDNCNGPLQTQKGTGQGVNTSFKPACNEKGSIPKNDLQNSKLTKSNTLPTPLPSEQSKIGTCEIVKGKHIKQRRINSTVEISPGYIPKTVQNIVNERNRHSSPIHGAGKFAAIKRLSPSKPFYPDKGSSTQIKTFHKTPEKSLQKDTLQDSGRGSSKRNSPGSKLVWKSVENYGKKSKKVKLNTSISLLSDRSVGKLLASEDENEQFEGFSPTDISAESSLDSDASFVETMEIDLDENSHQEWVIDANMLAVNEDSNDMHKLLPELTSPGKRSDSSWGDACEDFIQSQLSFNNSLLKLNVISPCSPRNKRKRLEEENEKCLGVLLRTPKRKRKRMKIFQDSIEKVDNEIEFNHLSPQKIKAIISPVKQDSEKIVMSSSPLKNCKQTSTPFRTVSIGEPVIKNKDTNLGQNKDTNLGQKVKKNVHSKHRRSKSGGKSKKIESDSGNHSNKSEQNIVSEKSIKEHKSRRTKSKISM